MTINCAMKGILYILEWAVLQFTDTDSGTCITVNPKDDPQLPPISYKSSMLVGEW